MRIIFMGTPSFALPTLQALIDAPEHEVVAVYSQPPRKSGRGHKLTPSPVHQLAEASGIAVYCPTSLKSSQAQAEFISHSADIAVVAAYGLLLPPAILQGCPKGCINVHPSDLPRWRGAAPIARSIMAGDSASAMCIMQMDEGLDTGDILLREAVTIEAGTNAGALHDMMAEKGASCILQTLATYDSLTPAPQQGEASYAAKITKDDLPLNLQQSASGALNHILGLAPVPAARIDVAGESIKIFAASVSRSQDSPLSFKCADGQYLTISELQRPNKKRMAATEALRGWDIA